MPNPPSILSDILAATVQPRAAAESAPPAARTRNEVEDLLRLNDADWLRLLAGIIPDDLLIVCSALAPAWRERVLTSVDEDSRSWLHSNLAVIGTPAPTLLNEARSRVMATARQLLRDGTITLPAPEPVAATVSTPAPVSLPVSVEKAAEKITAPRASATHLDELFADLLRLRNQAGVAALAQLATETSDPFLKSGLCLVAAGLPAADLERTLDGALARHVETYLDSLTDLRARLLALARGEAG